MITVAIAGALGRMGRFAYELIEREADLVYAGGLGRVRDAERRIADDVDALMKLRPDVVVDFTPRPVTQRVAHRAVECGVVPIIGSSEWNDEERAALQTQCTRRGATALLVPNFSIGAVLMMRFAQAAAPFFPTAEIVELHHAGKRDAPSGTARATAQRIAQHGGPAVPAIHSVRLQGLVAHQEVLFGRDGEVLTIRHDTFSRESFAAGMLLAIRRARTLTAFNVGLDAVMPWP